MDGFFIEERGADIMNAAKDDIQCSKVSNSGSNVITILCYQDLESAGA